MTDLEITKLCAEAMGWKHLGAVGIEPPKRGEPDPQGLWCLSGGNDWWLDPEGHSVCAPCSGIPDPLGDDVSAMALVKRFLLEQRRNIYISPGVWVVSVVGGLHKSSSADLNRAIAECVAKMQAAHDGDVSS